MRKITTTLIMIFMMGTITSQTERSVNDAHGIPVGIPAPMFSAIDADSNVFSLAEAINKGPVVIIFYRGFWCPVCNKHLLSIQDSLKMLEETGAKVIAISPEKPEYLDKMAEKTGAKFTLLYDEGYRIADAYDVTFKPTAMKLFTYNTLLGGKLKKTHSDDSQRLPIPATYIVNRQGMIMWRQFDPDYKNRASVNDILKALNTIDGS